MIYEWTRGDYSISTDPDRLDFDVIYHFLSNTYWAQGRSRERMLRSIGQSIPFGLYHGAGQVGFARVVTDYVNIAYLSDVFVLEAHRGRGLGVWLAEMATGLPDLKHIRRWLLGTRDAQELYRKIGFTETRPGHFMEIFNPDSDKQL